MDKEKFISKICDCIIDTCNKNNLLPSPTIAQAIIESDCGGSELALNANALFGIKADSRWNGKVYKKKTKEFKDGKYIDVIADFRAYDSWEDSIIDHTKFLTSYSRYSNLIGVEDYKKYCELIAKDGYATSPTYSNTLINCIESNNLSKYDCKNESVNSMKFNIHAGHNSSGMIACGSIGYLNESDENRNVCKGLVEKINNSGNIAYDCTCNNGTSQKDVLKKIVAKCNTNNVDYNISIHFNALSKSSKDGKTKGVEVWINPKLKGTMTESIAKNICDSVSKLGFANRGVKYSDTLYVLKNLSNCMLIECCFVDDEDDFLLYNPSKMIDSIFNGLNINIIPKDETVSDKLYYVIAGVYSKLDNAKSLQEILAKNGYLANDEGNLIKGIVTQIKEFGKE